MRTAIPDATPEEVCGLIDRGSGEPPDTFWTLDPIDGTKGFLRREQYAIALAFVENGKVELGVLGCPESDSDTILPRCRRRRSMVPSSSLSAAKGTFHQPLDDTVIGAGYVSRTRSQTSDRPHSSLGRKSRTRTWTKSASSPQLRHHRAAGRDG